MPLIVIVDDRATNRTVYAKLAQSIAEGVKVRAFADPREALQWMAGRRPDLIVTDHDMPTISGDEFIARFRALPGAETVPIMMVTVNDQRALRLRALESGATDFLTTPIDHFEFLSRARNLLRLRASASEPTSAPPATAPCDLEGDTRALLARCGGEAPYALHVLEASAPNMRGRLVGALRRQMRDGDLLGAIDARRLMLLQAGASDAEAAAACARRLRALDGVDAVGTALPRPADSRERRAVDCLRAAVAGLHGATAADWRFLPRISLRAGMVRGAQLLDGDVPALANDVAALRAALDGARALREANRPLRMSLRLGLGGDDDPTALLAEAANSGDALDLQFCALETVQQPERADKAARLSRSLGAQVTLDLRRLAPRDRREGEACSVALESFAETFRPALMFPASDRRAASVARLVRAAAARRLGRAPALIADGLVAPQLLPALRRAGVSAAQGRCFGPALAMHEFRTLLSAWPDEDAGHLARRA